MIEEDASRILEMEKKLFGMRLPAYFYRGEWLTGSFKESITIRELSSLVPEVSWKDYIKETLKKNPSGNVDPSSKVYIPDRHLLQALGKFAGELSDRDRANLLIWRIFTIFANDFFFTGSESGDLQESRWEGRGGITRKESCFRQIDHFFPNAYDDLTIAKNADTETTANMKTLFQNIAKEFEKTINDQNWMSGSTKRSALEKVQAMKINIGERTPNTPEYKQLKEKITDDDYIGNILAIGNYHFESRVKKLNKPIQPERYGKEQVANAFYFPGREK